MTTLRVRHALVVLALTGLALLGLAAACGSPDQQATPTPTKTPRPVATEAPVATPTSVPTPVLELPTATQAPPTATPEPTSAPQPTETPAPAGSDAPGNNPGAKPTVYLPAREKGVSIFTGLRPADPSVLERRPLAIKIPNERSVIPQSGLSKADVVVESRVEFCMTRYTVIFQSQDTERVGNIRSARLIDAELPVIFDAILAFSGGVEPVRQKLYKSDLGDHILEQALNGTSFFRDPNIPVPHNLFANTATLWNTATRRGWNKPPQPTAAWVFSEAAPAGGSAARRIDIPYPEFRVSWSYDSSSGRWLRTMGGQPHIEKLDGQQLSAANVVVIGANHVPTLIPEHGTTLTDGACSNRSIEIQLWGEGPVSILRDGKVYQGKWVRPERFAPFRFVDAAGNDIPLKPGNSWWQVTPLDMKVTIAP